MERFCVLMRLPWILVGCIARFSHDRIKNMAIPKKGSRSIVVDGTTFRWRVRKKPTYNQCLTVWDGGVGDITFSVQHAETPGSVLVVHLPQAYPSIKEGSSGVPIPPSQVAQYIAQALKSGWKATEAGNPFHIRVT